MRALLLLTIVSLARSTAAGPFDDQQPNTWVKRSPTAGKPVPKFGWEGSGAWDPANRLWIHHAGHDGIPQGMPTFVFDPATAKWSQRFPQTSPPGVCCVDGANTFDVARGRFVRFPGGSLGHGYQWSRGVRLKESPVWLYDPKNDQWENRRPGVFPGPTTFAKNSKDWPGGLNPIGAYDPVHELSISFGGGGKNTLFFYDAWSNTIWARKPAGKAAWPSERDGSGMAYDAPLNKLVLFGGQYSSDERTWIYDVAANTWEALDLDPRPPAKKGKTYSTIPKLTYDSVNGVMLCVVWLDEERGHETWALNVGQRKWTKMSPPAEPEPSKSRTRNLDFTRADNVAILETWTVKSEPQVWTYRYATAPVAEKLPGKVESVSAAALGNGAVTLTWTDVAGGNGYRVYRGQGLPWEVDFKAIDDTKSPTYDDTTAQSGVAYAYVVRALGADGREGPASFLARSEPPAPAAPIISALAKDKVRIAWLAAQEKDVASYEVWRARVTPKLVIKGTPGAWKDNDPEYAKPVVAAVEAIAAFEKLATIPADGSLVHDDAIDLAKDPAKSDAGDYGLGVYAYVLRTVNRNGMTSGPSPYALSIPREPEGVMCREVTRDGQPAAELTWRNTPEQGVVGWHVYKLEGVWPLRRVTDAPLKTPGFVWKGKDTTRFWVTAVDTLGQEGTPSSEVWYGKSYKGFFDGEWHQ
ncbi:MAG: hypothetical protein ACAI43_00145 [Phycisphaerae bacterium]